MIYTVTFNPCLDYIVRVDELQLGTVNRATYDEVLEGGKGINVSIVLNNLGIQSIALGFIAGFTGIQIEKGIRTRGCRTDFIDLENGMSRINVKIQAAKETDINGQGPSICQIHIDQLFDKLSLLEANDILVLAGSIPNTLPTNIYEKIMENLQDRQIRIVVDATKDLLLNVLKYHPFLVKPNLHELEEMFDVKLSCDEEIITYGKKLRDMGAANVLISMAGDGAILIAEDGKVYQSQTPRGKLVNSVGAGDSMVAGFIAGYIAEGNYEKAFKMGIATGSASAFSSQLATKEEVEALLINL